MYEGDSFFTLTLAGQVGLLLLSTLLMVLSIWLVWRLGKNRSLPTCIVLAAVVYFAFIWLAPQIYYTYYLFLFDSLPIQIVVQSPPGIKDLFDLMFFRENQNLSFHAQGALGWLLLGVGLVRGSQALSR